MALTEQQAPIVIVGAGYAGLAAAVELAAAGRRVVVLEAGKTLGGRARGVALTGLSEGGETSPALSVDNGQHLLVGAYRELLRLMDRVGALSDGTLRLLRQPLDLTVPGVFRLRCPRLPAPLHLALGLGCAQGLSWGERWAAVRMMQTAKRQRFRLARDLPLGTWLEQQGQPERLVMLLWEPLCLAALNTPLAEASAQVFLNVLRDSLMGTRADSDFLLPRVDLSALFPDPAARWLTGQGSEVHGGCLVQSIGPAAPPPASEGAGWQVRTRDGVWHAATVICAVAPHRLDSVLTDPMFAPLHRQLAVYQYQPIYTVYLQYPATTRLAAPMFGMSGTLGQWVFDRGQFAAQPGLLAVSISVAGPHQALSHAALAEQVHAELCRHIMPLPPYVGSRVIAEKRATYACVPDLPRPACRTAWPGLYLAGDYTQGAYPATIEGAIRSGVQCARHILESS